jgi:DNA-binding HxlR family transcriptional regulator
MNGVYCDCMRSSATASRDGRFDIMTASCPTREVIEQIGRRWGILVLNALEDGPQRYGQIRDLIEGVSQKVLTETLRTFERDGFVQREVRFTVPVTVEYRLTPLGSNLANLVSQLREWAYANMDEIGSARERYDTEKEQGDRP